MTARRSVLVEELQVGTRTVRGNDFPVVDQLRRSGKGEWSVVRELCDGVPRRTEPYSSEAEARAAFGARIEGRKPEASSPATKRITIRMTEADYEAARKAASDAGYRDLSKWWLDAGKLALARGSTR